MTVSPIIVSNVYPQTSIQAVSHKSTENRIQEPKGYSCSLDRGQTVCHQIPILFCGTLLGEI